MSDYVASVNAAYPQNRPPLRDERAINRAASLTQKECDDLDALLLTAIREQRESPGTAFSVRALAAALDETLALLGFYWPEDPDVDT